MRTYAVIVIIIGLRCLTSFVKRRSLLGYNARGADVALRLMFEIAMHSLSCC